MFRYVEWSDFGPTGVDPDEVDIEYDPSTTPDRPPDCRELIEVAWERLSDSDPGLYDAPLFDLRSVARTRLSTGTARFKQYHAARSLLNGHPALEDLSVPGHLVRELRGSVRVLSSFTAVRSNGQVLLGVKPGGTEGPYLSFPGSGYLDPEEDLVDGDRPRPTAEIIGREVTEELNVPGQEGDWRVLGVYEDISVGSHHNPALFCVLDALWEPDRILERSQAAPDSDEFEELAFVPLTGEVLSGLLQFGLTDEHSPPDPVEEATTIDELEGLSHKTLLMVLLLGRLRFGTDWFAEAREGRRSLRIHSLDGNTPVRDWPLPFGPDQG